MGDWHQAYGFRWRSPSDSINDPHIETISDQEAAGGAAGMTQGQKPSAPWTDTGYGTQYQGSSLDNATALRESRTGQSLPLQHTTVDAARQATSGTPWHEASGAFAGQHAGQFWKSPTNSINDLNIQWSTSDPSGGAQWQDSGLGFRYKSPTGQATDPNVVIDPYVPGGKRTTPLSPQEADSLGAYMKSQEPRVTQAPAAATATSPPAEKLPPPDPSMPNYAKLNRWKQVVDALGVPYTKEAVLFLTAWQEMEGGEDQYNSWFNTSQGEPGAWAIYPDEAPNIMGYPDEATGVQAIVHTLQNGLYDPILEAFRNGASADEIAQAVQDSPWASSHYMQDTEAPGRLRNKVMQVRARG